MNVNKLFGVALIAMGYLYGTVWLFNHVDVWVGIGVGVLGLFISAKLIFKKQK